MRSIRAVPMTPDAERTLAAMEAKRWKIVRLHGKRPEGTHWQITTDPDEVGRWLASGSNIGLVCREQTGVAVLDPDHRELWADMVSVLGPPCGPWVVTGSGRLHYYIAWRPNLPAKLVWQRTIIGEIMRGPGQQQVVLPPSIHPGTGLRYQWIAESLHLLGPPVNPSADPLPLLPAEWRAYLHACTHR